LQFVGSELSEKTVTISSCSQLTVNCRLTCNVYAVTDVSVEFTVSCLSLDSDPFCHESTTDVHLLLKSVPSKVFAEQLTCKDAVSGIVFLLQFSVSVSVSIVWINRVNKSEDFLNSSLRMSILMTICLERLTFSNHPNGIHFLGTPEVDEKRMR